MWPEFYVKNRMINENRNKFYYSVIKEFPTIIGGIAFAMVFTLIIRGIVVVIFNRKNKLFEDIEIESSEMKKMEIIKNFKCEHAVQRGFGCVLMILIGGSLFYFMLLFCNFYHNTQIGWGYIIAWGVIIEYVILIPLLIIIVTVVEKKCFRKNEAYYFKAFFLF